MKFRFKSLHIVVILALALVSVVSVAAQDKPAGFPRTLVDDEGRELTLEKPPERVIAMYNAGYGVVATLGIRPVGVLANPEMLSDARYLEDGASIPSVEGSDGNTDFEKIAALKPDLIIGGDLDMVASLEGIAPIFIINYPQTMEAVYASLRKTATVFGLEDLAEEHIAKFENRIAAYQTLLPAEHVSTLITGIHTPEEIWFNTGNRASCQILNLFSTCNWESPTGENGFTGTMEALLNFNPDVLILGNWDPVNGYDALFEELKTNPLWNELSAVQNDRVIYIPTLTNPAPYSIVGATIMLDAFIPRVYPESFPDGALTDEQVEKIIADKVSVEATAEATEAAS